jgi:transposase
MIAELIFEAERKGNMAEICRREGIQPNLFYRWKAKFKEAGVQALAHLKRGRKPAQDQEKAELAKEIKKLQVTICDQAVELQLLKKSVHSDYMDP